MSSLRQMTEHAGEWLRGAGPHSEIVISSRIRLARNLAGFPFVGRANRRQRFEVLERCRAEVMSGRLADGILWVDLANSPPLDRQLLVERHLISRQHANANDDLPRAVAIGADETFAIMVNEEDHLRIQVLRSGMQLSEAFGQINRIDDVLEDRLDFAYSSRFGYATACPTNVGTGIRVSVMLHLPALRLTGEIEKVRRAARDMHLAVRGLFGEGSDALGDLYQVSNQTTLGKTEQVLLQEMEHEIIPRVMDYERHARRVIVEKRRATTLDRIMRSLGVLKHARLMTTEEAMEHLSLLRLGVTTGLLSDLDIKSLNRLFLLVQPAHLQHNAGRDLTQHERRAERATLLRGQLGDVG